jgi:hypothetical protein
MLRASVAPTGDATNSAETTALLDRCTLALTHELSYRIRNLRLISSQIERGRERCQVVTTTLNPKTWAAAPQVGCCTSRRGPILTAAVRSARPVLWSVSTATPHIVAAPPAPPPRRHDRRGRGRQEAFRPRSYSSSSREKISVNRRPKFARRNTAIVAGLCRLPRRSHR